MSQPSLFSDVVETFIKLEANHTEKPMISILDETSHHHIQITGPSTLPTAAFLMFCVGKFQPGTFYAESTKAGPGDQEAVARGNKDWPSKRFAQCLARDSCPAKWSPLCVSGSSGFQCFLPDPQ